jgi:hypothetical protein
MAELLPGGGGVEAKPPRACHSADLLAMLGSMRLLPMFLPAALLLSCAPDPHSAEAHDRKRFGLLAKFDRFDYNGNGKLTRAEIEQGIRESDVGGVNREELDAAMKFYDVNRDGSISRWEAERGLDRPLPGHS